MSFDRIMRATPRIMTIVAMLCYLGTVITVIAASEEVMPLFREGMPVSVKARAFVLVFVQPLVPAFLLLSAAALLWRIDVWLARSSLEAGE